MQSDLILPIYTDKEIMMDNISPSNVDFKCIFEKFEVDEVSIDEAEADICLMLKSCLKALRVSV